LNRIRLCPAEIKGPLKTSVDTMEEQDSNQDLDDNTMKVKMITKGKQLLKNSHLSLQTHGTGESHNIIFCICTWTLMKEDREM